MAGSGMLFYAVNNGAFTSVPMTVMSGNLYSATLPAVQCTNTIKFYVTAQASNGQRCATERVCNCSIR